MSDDFTLQDAMKEIYRRWKLAAFLILATTSVSLSFALLLPPVYRAEVALLPGDAITRSAAGTSTLASRFGDLASIAGVTLPGGPQTNEAQALLLSRTLTETFIQDRHLLPTLFNKMWDPEAKAWKASLNQKDIPTLWHGNQLFKDRIRSFTEDRKTGLSIFAIEWTDPQLAAEWANDFVRLCNSMLRQQAIDRAQRNIQFLETQIKKNAVVEMRLSLYRLLEAELRTIMLAEGSAEYAFRVVDNATPPHKKIRPKSGLIILTGFFIGVVASLFLILVFPQQKTPG